MRLPFVFLLLATAAFGQTASPDNYPSPLQVTRVYGITSPSQVQDNRSMGFRGCNYHGFDVVSGTQSWSVQMEYSDTSASGPWTLFGSNAVVTYASAVPVGAGWGYHKWIRFNTTSGTTQVNYACSLDYFINPQQASGGGSGNPGGNPGQIQYNIADSSFGGFTASGDATINTTTGVVKVQGLQGYSLPSPATGCLQFVGGALAWNTCPGAGTLPGGTPGQIQTNVSNTTFGGFTPSGDISQNTTTGVTTVVGIQGVAVPSPTTGCLNYSGGTLAWTGCIGGGGTVTTSGSPVSTNLAAFSAPTVITAATVANIFSLFTGCAGSDYPGYDGACHSGSIPTFPTAGYQPYVSSSNVLAANAAPVNVLGLGADPTGAVSSTTAFADAVALAGSNSSVIIPPGTYLLSTQWNISSINNLHIIADGATVVCGMSSADCIYISGGGNYRGTTISGLTIKPSAQSTYAGIHDAAWAVTIERLNAVRNGTNYFANLIQVDNDQEFALNETRISDTVVECDSGYCGNLLYNPSGQSGIGWIVNTYLDPACQGNGVEWDGGNELSFTHSVVQAYSQFGIRMIQGNGFGHDLHIEAGGCTNPLGNIGKAGLIGIFSNFQTDNGSLGGSQPSFTVSAPGSTKYAYYILPHNTSSGWGAPLPLSMVTNGPATISGGATITLYWPSVGVTGSTSLATDYDILRVPIASAGNIIPLFTGNWLVANVSQSGGAGTTQTYVDSVSSPTSITPPTPLWYPELSFWPGSVVLSTNNNNQFDIGTFNGPAASNSFVVSVWDTAWPKVNWINGTITSYGANTQLSSSFLNSGQQVQSQAYFVPYAVMTPLGVQAGSSSFAAPLKGIFNTHTLSYTGPTDILTAYDSTYTTTMGTPSYRPLAAAGDSAICQDGLSTKNELCFRSPTNLDSYINHLPDGVNWLTRLNATQFASTVPITAPSINATTIPVTSPCTDATLSAALASVSTSTTLSPVVVQLPPGTCSLSNTVASTASNFILQGAPGGTIIQAAMNAWLTNMITFTGSYITVRGIKFDGNIANYGMTWGLQSYNSSSTYNAFGTAVSGTCTSPTGVSGGPDVVENTTGGTTTLYAAKCNGITGAGEAPPNLTYWSVVTSTTQANVVANPTGTTTYPNSNIYSVMLLFYTATSHIHVYDVELTGGAQGVYVDATTGNINDIQVDHMNCHDFGARYQGNNASFKNGLTCLIVSAGSSNYAIDDTTVTNSTFTNIFLPGSAGWTTTNNTGPGYTAAAILRGNNVRFADNKIENVIQGGGGTMSITGSLSGTCAINQTVTGNTLQRTVGIINGDISYGFEIEGTGFAYTGNTVTGYAIGGQIHPCTIGGTNTTSEGIISGNVFVGPGTGVSGSTGFELAGTSGSAGNENITISGNTIGNYACGIFLDSATLDAPLVLGVNQINPVGSSGARCGLPTTATTNEVNALTVTSGSTTSGIGDFPQVITLPAATCEAGTAATSVWSSAGTGFGGFSPHCRGGTYNIQGSLQAVPSTGAVAQFLVDIPADYDMSTQPYIRILYGSGSNTSGTVIWTIGEACLDTNGSVTDDPSFNTEGSAFATQTMAAANRTWTSSGQLTYVGGYCYAGGAVLINVTLSGTASSAINVYDAVVTIPRKLVSQAN